MNTDPFKDFSFSDECEPIVKKLEEMTKNRAYFKTDRFNNS